VIAELGFEVAQSSITKYMDGRRRPVSQGSQTFLRNHTSAIVAMDLLEYVRI
jgi:hypothetical protein